MQLLIKYKIVIIKVGEKENKKDNVHFIHE